MNDYQIPTLSDHFQRLERARAQSRAADAQGVEREDEGATERVVKGRRKRVSQLDAKGRVQWHLEQARWHRDMAAKLSAGQTWMGSFLPRRSGGSRKTGTPTA